MVKKRATADHRADTRGGALSGLPHAVSDSPAFLDLTVFERAVFAEILRRFNGYNNGCIGITYEEIGARIRGPNKSLPNNGRTARAIVSLMEHGFIAEPTTQLWLQRMAREYHITFISSGKGPPFRQPTNEYLKWTPRVKNDGNAASPDTPLIGNAASPEEVGLGDAGSPAKAKNGSFALNGSVHSGDTGSLLIVKPSPGLEKEGPEPSNIPPEKSRPLAHEEPLEAMRSSIAEWWRTANAKDRIGLAKRHKIEVAELSSFVAGLADLSIHKAVALRSAVASPRAA